MLKKERAIVFNETDVQGTISETLVDDYLLTWLEAFMIDRKAQRVSKGTIHQFKYVCSVR